MHLNAWNFRLNSTNPSPKSIFLSIANSMLSHKTKTGEPPSRANGSGVNALFRWPFLRQLHRYCYGLQGIATWSNVTFHLASNGIKFSSSYENLMSYRHSKMEYTFPCTCHMRTLSVLEKVLQWWVRIIDGRLEAYLPHKALCQDRVIMTQSIRHMRRLFKHQVTNTVLLFQQISPRIVRGKVMAEMYW